MAYLSRLIAVIFLLVFSPFSNAAIYNGVEYVRIADLQARINNDPRTDANTPSAACQKYGPLQEASCQTMTLISSASCTASCQSGYTAYYPVTYGCFSGGTHMTIEGDSACWAPKPTCAANEAYNASTNTCEAPPPPCAENQERDPETGQCVCKTGPAGSFAVSGDTYVGCNDGCVIALNSGSYSASKNKTYGDWRQTGNTCAPSPDIPGTDPSDSPDGQDAGKCPTGQCPGTFNGQFMCVPCKGKESSDSSSSENTTETPNGASSPSSSSSESSSGSKSTECDGGVCVTKEKVVVVNPDGSTTEKEKETTESISDFCAKNPKAAICKAVDDGRWGGSCSGGFQCSGDPVQCAQAQAAWKSACAADVSGMTDQINVGTAAMSAGAASGLGLPGGDSAFDLSSRLSSAPLFGSSGSCPSDVTVSVSGQSYTMPFSSMCSNLRILGAALMAFAYLVAGFIVFRGDKS